MVGDSAEDGNGCGEAKDIAHGRGTVRQGAEEMIVLHVGKGAAEHGVLEGVGWVESGNSRGKALAYAEVSSLPGHDVSQTHQAGGETAHCDGLLAGVGCADEVNVDGTCKIEDAFDGSLNDGEFVESDHRIEMLSPPSEMS